MTSAQRVPSHSAIVIIGAGVLGSSTAFHLASLGEAPLLLDRGPVGAETSSQGAGFLCSVRSTLASTRVVAHSTRFYARFQAETGYAIDIHMTGALRVALTQATLDTLRADAATAKEAGIEIRFVDPAEIKRLAPGMSLADAVGGTFVPLEGYVTATRDVAIGFARGAAKRGALVRTHVDVKQIEHARGGEYQITTSHGTIRAGKVLLAANAGAWPLTRRMGSLYPSYPFLHECAVYGLPADIAYGMPTVRIGERDLYIRHEAAGLLIGGVGKIATAPSPTADAADFYLARTDLDPLEFSVARERAAPFVPGLADAICVREQRGLAMVAPDLEPLAGEWLPNLYVMSADLRGVQSAPGLGLLMAQLTTSGTSEFDTRPFDPKRFGMVQDADAFRDRAWKGIRPKGPIG